MQVLEVQGLQTLLRRLKALPEKIQRVTMIKAVKAGAEPILLSARAKVPIKSGLLARSIQMKFTRRSLSKVEASVGVFKLTKAVRARNAKRFIKRTGNLPDARDLQDPYYALWVEKGHKIVKQGKQVGHVAARPFLRPAMDENVGRSVAIVAQVLREEIERVEAL